MSKLRDLARGEDCEIRLPGCRFMPEYTVLAHVRLAGLTGGAQKIFDHVGAHSCDVCHDYVDGRRDPPEGYTREMVEIAMAHGVYRTLYKLIKRGIIK